MNKGTHFSGQPMYGQLIDLLDKDEILKFSRAHHGERYVKHFDAYQHLTVMLTLSSEDSTHCARFQTPCFPSPANSPILA